MLEASFHCCESSNWLMCFHEASQKGCLCIMHERSILRETSRDIPNVTTYLQISSLAFVSPKTRISLKDNENLASLWCDEMCPIGKDTRVNFFANLDREFNNVKSEIESNEHSLYAAGIVKKYHQQMVGCFPRVEDNKPRVVLALDEAHVLHENDFDQPFLRADALLRTIKGYLKSNSHAAWLYVRAAMEVRCVILVNSARVSVEGESLLPPFTQLGWDQNAPALNEVQPEGVAKVGHIVRYGRPLWVSLKDGGDSLAELLQLAREKLRGSERFDPRNDHQALAVLAQR
ncbi:hypothetical protein OG21DRAFT_1500955 [Imleria badia]|nr:hypothetical protein OG21DRAFT_1500955 [Imleria badia]